MFPRAVRQFMRKRAIRHFAPRRDSLTYMYAEKLENLLCIIRLRLAACFGSCFSQTKGDQRSGIEFYVYLRSTHGST